MKRLAMVAAPYCYGPTSKLLCVAEELVADYELLFFSDEPGLSFAQDGPFRSCIRLADRGQWSNDSLDELKCADAMISFLDHRSLKAAQLLSIPTVFVDTLQWLRSSSFVRALGVHRYVAQRFLIDNKKSADQGIDFVGPILHPSLSSTHTQHSWCITGPLKLLVHVGGLRSPAMQPGADVVYLRVLAAILREAAMGVQYQITVALPKYLIPECAFMSALFESCDVVFPSPQAFSELHATADVLVTTPGLEIVLEAMTACTPIIFAPAYNATQCMQLGAYVDHDIAEAVLWHGMSTRSAASDAELRQLTQKLQTELLGLERQTSLQLRIGASLRESLEQIQRSPMGARNRVKRNLSLVQSLGHNGRARAAELIISAITSSTLSQV